MLTNAKYLLHCHDSNHCPCKVTAILSHMKCVYLGGKKKAFNALKFFPKEIILGCVLIYLKLTFLALPNSMQRGHAQLLVKNTIQVQMLLIYSFLKSKLPHIIANQWFNSNLKYQIKCLRTLRSKINSYSIIQNSIIDAKGN